MPLINNLSTLTRGTITSQQQRWRGEAKLTSLSLLVCYSPCVTHTNPLPDGKRIRMIKITASHPRKTDFSRLIRPWRSACKANFSSSSILMAPLQVLPKESKARSPFKALSMNQIRLPMSLPLRMKAQMWIAQA